MGLLTQFLATDPVPVNDLTLTDPRFAALFGGVRTFSGLSVTPEKAMRCGVVLACARTLIDDISKMPLPLNERTTDPATGRVRTLPALDHPLYSKLKDSPNDEMTSVEMRAVNMLHLLMTGNFYNQVRRNTDGEVYDIYPLSPYAVKSDRDANGELIFRYRDPVSGQTTTFPKEKIWRCQMMSFSGIDGQSMMLLIREAIGTLLAAEMQSGRLFSTAAQPSGTLNVPDDVEATPEQLQAALDKFIEQYSGVNNSNKTAMLPFGIKYEKISLTADEAQHIERQKFTAEDIVRAFGGGALMVRLGIGEKKNSTFASSVAFLDDYYKSVLTPYTTRIEQTITRDLLLPSERGRYFAKHNHDAILRGDIKSRYEAYGLAIDKGFKSPNDVLELEDENTVDGLDFYHINPNAVVIKGEIHTVGTAGAAPGAQGAEPPQTSAAAARLEILANAGAERIVRSEEKSGKFDAEFVVKVLAIELPKAQAYCEQRTSGTLKSEDAKAALVALAMES